MNRLMRFLARGSAFTALLVLFLIIVLWNHVVFTIPAGHAGVIWWRFLGGIDEAKMAYGSGTRLIFPWDELYIYDMRMQEHATQYEVISNEGLHVKIGVSFRWRVLPENLGRLHNRIGTTYLEKLLLPEIGSVLRREISDFTAEDLFTTKRASIQSIGYRTLTESTEPNGIGNRDSVVTSDELVSLLDLLLKEIVLPDRVRTAIEQKLEQGQVVEEYKFRVERERLESDRKAVEAEGIRRFQDIITPTISDAYLRWRGIEATLKLAESPNSKVVIIGNGPGGLPVILNGLDGKSDAPQAAPTSPGGR
jgi:regulator of protease activity HflC (stomatin/prohibitin superfamily)